MAQRQMPTAGPVSSAVRRRHWRRKPVALAGVAFVAALAVGSALAVSALHAGPQGNGTSITPIGWRITPAGKQLTVGERPYGFALSPDGKTLLVSNNGVAFQSLMSVNTATNTVASTIPYAAPEAVFLGVTFAPDGQHAYASAGANDKVRTYTVAGGALVEGAAIPLATTDGLGNAIHPFPAGLTTSADGKTLYVADDFSNRLSIVDVASQQETQVPLSSETCVIGAWGDTSNGKSCLFPYTVVLSHDGGSAYVSNWGQRTLSVVDTKTKQLKQDIVVGNHPSALALNPKSDELYVADTDGDTISVVDTKTNAVTQTISLRPYENAAVGASPNALAVSPDGSMLYVADAGDNDVAVINLKEHGKASVAGLIPTGWYPTGVAVDPSGKRLYVANAKGLGAGPNPGQPTGSPDQYIGAMIKGTLSTIEVPSASALAVETKQVIANNGFDKKPGKQGFGKDSPIKHVIYVVNENRTYDQVLGDLGKGNGDPSLTLFGWNVAPNHHQLAKQFTDLDNLYAAGEVSNDGWEWSTAGNANTLNQKTWPTLYGGRGHFYSGEGGTLAAAPGFDPAQSYIWNELDKAGLSYRNYGFWATDVPPVSVYNQPVLDAHTDHNYAGFNMQISDQDRFAEWLKEFKAYDESGKLPTVEFLKFPRDHTCGASPSCPTPQAMVADSDYALGRLVDTISHSQFWKSTAIFVIEDDAQDGPDHVDAHRTVGHVISPYTQLGSVDSTFYSSESMLRTMELILGLAPLTQFDASAIPMGASFSDKPNLTPYDAIKPATPLTVMNSANAPLASASAGWDFSREDLAPEQLLNQAIWKSVKGGNSPMPLPHHHLLSADPDDD